jgi:hypothetical protein
MVTVGGLNQHGTLTLENDTGGIYFVVSQINGRAYVENITAPAPVENMHAPRRPARRAGHGQPRQLHLAGNVARGRQ